VVLIVRLTLQLRSRILRAEIGVEFANFHFTRTPRLTMAPVTLPFADALLNSIKEVLVQRVGERSGSKERFGPQARKALELLQHEIEKQAGHHARETSTTAYCIDRSK
jgi:hypothetical protein